MPDKIRQSGPSPQDRARFARKLVGADLAAEQAKAEALLAEAKAERAAAPDRAADLTIRAKSRMTLIAAEREQREALDGDLARALEGLSDAELAAREGALADGPGTKPERLAIRREQVRRVAAAEARRSAREAARVKDLKQDVREEIAGLAPGELRRERALEGIRVEAVQAKLRAAKQRLSQAKTPEARTRAEAAVKQVEQQLRTEYARRSVLKAGGEAKPDRRALGAYEKSVKGLAGPALAAERSRVAAELERMTTGGIRGSREAIALAQAKLAALDGKIDGTAPAAEVQAPGEKKGPGGAPVWKEPGVFVWHAGAFPADIAVERLKAQGIKWVTLQISDGTTVNDETEKALASGYIEKLRAAGIKVGFWGVNRTEPEAEARLAAEKVKQWGADFYIANAEFEYKYTTPQGDHSAEAFGRSKRWIDTFRKALPDLPSAISSYGRTDLADLDWKAWRDAGFDWLPQAYMNEFDIYDPKLCVEAAVKDGWPKDRVHPTLGIWGGGQKRVVPASEYIERLREAGSVGFSSYLAEQTPEEEWAVLGQAIARGDISQ